MDTFAPADEAALLRFLVMLWVTTNVQCPAGNEAAVLLYTNVQALLQVLSKWCRGRGTWQLHDARLCCNAAHEAVSLRQVAGMIVGISSQPALTLDILYPCKLFMSCTASPAAVALVSDQLPTGWLRSLCLHTTTGKYVL